MESDIQQHHRLLHDRHYQLHHRQMNSGLTQYQSAPSLYLTSLVDRKFCEQFVSRPSSPETERIFARVMTGGSGTHRTPSHRLGEIERNSLVGEAAVVLPEADRQTRYLSSTVKSEAGDVMQNQCGTKNYSFASHPFHQNKWRPPLPNKSMSSGMESTYSMGMRRLPPMRTGGGGIINSRLLRQSSSPAELCSHINVESGAGYVMMREMRDFETRISSNEQTSFPSRSNLRNFISRPTFSKGQMSIIAEIDDKNMAESNSKNTGIIDDDGTNDFPGFLFDSWDENTLSSDHLDGQKRLEVEDDDVNMSQNQHMEARNHPPALARHLSLPKTCSELGAIQKLLEFSNSVPCKMRAKRGCATHPRSIAERVRRARISERMRKLQELIPNMDKQTNTSEMLDLAIEYIKDLQKQVQMLSDNREKCNCSNREPRQH